MWLVLKIIVIVFIFLIVLGAIGLIIATLYVKDTFEKINIECSEEDLI